MNRDERRTRINDLQTERHALTVKINSVNEELKQLNLANEKEDHPCSCVRLNGDIEIYDMQEQTRRGRNPLGLGLVSQCLSARAECPVCKGTGKPA
jgi:DNA repair exonuclease SbcCD ATPase subunit